MTKEQIKALADRLHISRPQDIYTNTTKREQWYADVAAIAILVPAPARHQFFDDCGVPF
jgi:hypothetical protein